MLDQNTDRMWFVIGAVIVGAAIIFIANGTLPTLFASVSDSFEESATKGTDVIDEIKPNIQRQLLRIEQIQAREQASLNGLLRGAESNLSGEHVVEFMESHDGTWGIGTDFVFWFHRDDLDHMPEYTHIELSFDVRSDEAMALGMRTGSRILSDDHYRIPVTTEWTTLSKKIPYSFNEASTNPRAALVLWSEAPAKVYMRDFKVTLVGERG